MGHYKKVENGKGVYYVYSGEILLYEVTPADGKAVFYIYLNGKQIAKVEKKNGVDSKYFYHTDHLGSTRAITNEQGNVVGRFEYQPFGAEESTTGDDTLTFTGKMQDDPTGLMYFNARYYDPMLGRFITEDLMGYGANWYVYCSNAPMTRIDINGMYDIAAADAYATKYAEKYNSLYDIRRWPWPNYSWSDCTNFVSQVLYAGGIKMRPGIWYFNQGHYDWKGTANSHSNSWTESTAFVNWIRSEKNILSYEIVLPCGSTRQEIAKVAGKVQVGDVIGFVRSNLPSNQKVDASQVHHLVVITDIRDGKIYYSGHSTSRLDYDLLKPLQEESVVIFHINPDAK